MNKQCFVNDDLTMTFPDNWPGTVADDSRVIINENGDLDIMSLRESYIQASFIKVMIFSENKYATLGIRYCLGNKKSIKLNVVENINELDGAVKSFSPHIIIFVGEKSQEIGSFLKTLFIYRAANSETKVIMISNIHEKFIKIGQYFLGDVLVCSQYDNVNLIDKSISFLIHSKKKKVSYKLPLTSRQKIVIYLMSQGLKAKEIAKKLNVSVKTISVHKTSALKKLGASNRVEIAWLFDAVKSLNNKDFSYHKIQARTPFSPE